MGLNTGPLNRLKLQLFLTSCSSELHVCAQTLTHTRKLQFVSTLALLSLRPQPAERQEAASPVLI